MFNWQSSFLAISILIRGTFYGVVIIIIHTLQTVMLLNLANIYYVPPVIFFLQENKKFQALGFSEDEFKEWQNIKSRHLLSCLKKSGHQEISKYVTDNAKYGECKRDYMVYGYTYWIKRLFSWFLCLMHIATFINDFISMLWHLQY